MHYEQLGLGTVLARAQACDGVGPAVELPGLGHVVDAQDEGQAAREECVSQLRVKDQVVAVPSRTIVVHAAAGENVRRVSVDALVRRAGQCPQVGQRVLVPHGHIARLLLQTPHAAQCQWPLLCEGAPLSREAVAQQDVRAGSPAPGTASAGGARSRSACPPCAPPGAARSRPGLASSRSGAGLRRA